MIAPLKCTKGLCSTGTKNQSTHVHLLHRSEKHFNDKDFEQNFEQLKIQQNERIHQLEQKQGLDNVWYIDVVQLHELDNVINKLHNTAFSFDENNFHPTMIVKSDPKIRTCVVNLFNSCLTNSQWLWTDSRVLFIKKHCKPNYTNPSA